MQDLETEFSDQVPIKEVSILYRNLKENCNLYDLISANPEIAR